jgi:hypothetical protein
VAVVFTAPNSDGRELEAATVLAAVCGGAPLPRMAHWRPSSCSVSVYRAVTTVLVAVLVLVLRQDRWSGRLQVSTHISSFDFVTKLDRWRHDANADGTYAFVKYIRI